MKRGMMTFAAMFAMMLAGSRADAVDWTNYQVGRIFMPDDRDCLFFTLSGSPEPILDPAVANQPWVAVPRSQNGFKEIYALLLWAKATGTGLTLRTTGAPADPSCNTHGVLGAVYQLSLAN